MPNLANLVTCLVEKLHREGSATYASAVCLEDAEDFSNRIGSYAQACADTAASRTAATHEGVCAVVDVEHSALCTFC